MVGLVHVEQRAHRAGTAAELRDGAVLEPSRQQGKARLVEPDLVVALHLHHVFMAQHRPKWPVGLLIDPQDVALLAHRGQPLCDLAFVGEDTGGKGINRAGRPVHGQSSHLAPPGSRSTRSAPSRLAQFFYHFSTISRLHLYEK
jgi:hypothetical protein